MSLSSPSRASEVVQHRVFGGERLTSLADHVTRNRLRFGDESRWRNRVSAAWLLGPPYRPIQHSASLHCPWLVCVAADDEVAKPGPAIEAARGKVSSAFIRASIISIFTMGRLTRRWSLTRSNFFNATFWAGT